MKKVILWNKTEYFIKNEREQALVEAIDLAKNEGTGFYLNHAGGRVWIGNPKAVWLITDAGADAPERVEPSKWIHAPVITDEQHAANVAKLHKMKLEFLAKQRAKRDKK